MFKLRIDIENTGFGHVKACADDVGILLYKLISLTKVANIFEKYRKLFGLILKPAKSIIVLVASLANKQNCLTISDWLKVFEPGWAGMNIVSHAK